MWKWNTRPHTQFSAINSIEQTVSWELGKKWESTFINFKTLNSGLLDLDGDDGTQAALNK